MVNRKDFRPSDSYSSSKPVRQPVQPKKKVVESFVRGEGARTGNDSLSSDGKTLYSYNTAIAVRQSDGTVLVNNTKYSQTTTQQQNILIGELKSKGIKYDVTGGKERGYQGEDFSKDENYSSMRKDLTEKEKYEHNKKELSKIDRLQFSDDEEKEYYRKQLDKDIREYEYKNSSVYKKEVAKEQSEHPQLTKKQAETIVKQHQKADYHTTENYNNHKIDVYYSKKDDDYTLYVDGNHTRTMSTKENAINYGKTYIDAEFKNKPQGRMTLAEIKSENNSAGQYFFSPSTMRMYRQVNAKYRVKYDKKTDTNYVIVNMKKYPESTERKEVVYKYNKENGHLDIQN